MAQRKKSGLADAVVDITALLPWWVGVALAVLSYLLLHSIAIRPVGTLEPGQLGGFAVKAIWRGLATAGQYVLPFFCLFGAGISAYKRHRSKKLIHSAVKRID
jgi:restriction system protein